MDGGAIGNAMSFSFNGLMPLSQPPAVRRQGNIKVTDTSIADRWHVRQTSMRDISKLANSDDKGKMIDVTI